MGQFCNVLVSKDSLSHYTGIRILTFMWKRLDSSLLCRMIFCRRNCEHVLFDCFSFASKYCRRTMEVGKQRMQFRFLQLPSYLNSLAKLYQSINCRWELCSRFLKFRKYIRQYKYAGVTSRKYGQDYNRKCNEMQLPGTCYGMLANISVSHYASLIFVFLQILQLLYYVLVRAFRLCVFLENS